MAASVLLHPGPAGAEIVPTVPLATAGDYAVLGATTVTNTGGSSLDGSLGLWPGSSITGFPPGQVVPPGRTDTTNGAAQQAKSDLTAAYNNAAGRPVSATTTADLVNLNLLPGVYSGPSKSPLSLSGPLVLDGGGDLEAVFIFQTDSTLVTASGSTVRLINGAQECNVFWQVGSSATLGTGSTFIGNILALTSITVTTGVTVRGRALARNAAVTLDTDTFTRPTCAQRSSGATTTTTAPTGLTTGTTTPGGGATPGDESTPSAPGDGTSTELTRQRIRTGLTVGGPAQPGAPGSPGTPGVPRIVGPPRTGGGPLGTAGLPVPVVLLVGLVGAAATAGAVQRRRSHADTPTAGR